MGVAGQIGLVAAGLTWRSVGVKSAGRALIHGLEGGESERTLAGMALVQAGERSVALIEEHLQSAEPSTMVVRVLSDIEAPESRNLLRRIAGDDTEAGRLAKQSVDESDR